MSCSTYHLHNETLITVNSRNCRIINNKKEKRKRSQLNLAQEKEREFERTND